MKIDNDDEYIAAKTRLTLAQAEKYELQVGELKGRLIDRDKVSHLWNEKAVIVKNKLLALPELAPALFGLGSIQAVKKELKARVYEILEELAGGVSQEWK